MLSWSIWKIDRYYIIADPTLSAFNLYMFMKIILYSINAARLSYSCLKPAGLLLDLCDRELEVQRDLWGQCLLRGTCRCKGIPAAAAQHRCAWILRLSNWITRLSSWGHHRMNFSLPKSSQWYATYVSYVTHLLDTNEWNHLEKLVFHMTNSEL